GLPTGIGIADGESSVCEDHVVATQYRRIVGASRGHAIAHRDHLGSGQFGRSARPINDTEDSAHSSGSFPGDVLGENILPQGGRTGIVRRPSAHKKSSRIVRVPGGRRTARYGSGSRWFFVVSNWRASVPFNR